MPKSPPKYDPLGRTPQQKRSRYDAVRGSAAERGYGARWQRYSVWFRSQPENVLCACGCNRPTQGKRGCVDHIIACEPNDARFWDMRNHQALTNRCHGTKTRRFDDARQRRGTEAELQKMLDAARERAESIEARTCGGWQDG